MLLVLIKIQAQKLNLHYGTLLKQNNRHIYYKEYIFTFR